MALVKPILLKESPLWLFRVRLGGLTGLLVGGIGGVFMAAGFFWLGLVLAALGAGAAVVALIFEVRSFAGLVGARRGAAGSNVAVQVLLAVGLLVEVNAFSFFHYRRADWTSTHEYTLDPQLKRELGKLRGETYLVVNVRHSFGQLGSNRDEYDHAAERVVIDKVEEVAEQLREFGPQFRVFVLDVKDKRYGDKLKQLAKSTDSEELKKAIQESAEDSIFILAEKKVQRLGFQDLFQLDKKASRSADDGNGNLVMHYQGAGPLVRRILNLDNRKPRVAIGVIHEALSTESRIDEFTMAGARKALADNGFETLDIILKADLETRAPKAAVRTLDENKYERLDNVVAQSDKRIKQIREELAEWKKLIKRWRTGKLADLSKEFARQLGGKKIANEEQREMIVRLNFEPKVTILQLTLDEAEEDRRVAATERSKLNVADLTEQRRLSDLKAKLDRKLEKCDLLILPRLTLLDAASGRAIPNSLHQLDPAQESAIQDFLKKGKPVLALFGPSNDPRGMPADMMHGGGDGLERMLGRLGIRFGKETFLFDSELKSFGEQRGNLFILGTPVEVPPVRFQWVAGGRTHMDNLIGRDPASKRPNPIAESMRLTVAGLDEAQKADIRVKHPRPIDYFAPGMPTGDVDPTFLMTDPRGWKETNPFPSDDGVPKRDPKKEGQASIGVAVEAPLPPDWKPARDHVRIAAIGQGGIFVGKQLSPVQEKLLLDVSNWLLGRDDMLNRPQEEPWSYPRVELSNSDFLLWQWGARLGIPVLFAYLGIVVLMVRAMR